MVAEKHKPLEFTFQQSFRTDLVSQYSSGAPTRRSLVIWDSTTAGQGTQRDIIGGLYDRPLGGLAQPFCFGDGTGLACPCGNNGGTGRGCPNSLNSNGALLATSGSAQTGSGDSLSFVVQSVPPNVSATLFQGSAANSGVVFGDGVRCAVGTVIRIRSKFTNASGSATWPTAGEASVSVAGLIPLSGARHYDQVSYRNAAPFCTSATFNTSNGIDVVWLP